jgi:hypothetical protein
MAYDLDVSDLEGLAPSEGDPAVAQTPETTPDVVKTEEPQVKRFKYTANGREIEEDLDTILQRASQGYNYAQHMQELKAKQTEMEKLQESTNQLRSKWEQYDKYATDNPQWAEFVRSQWENRNASNEGSETPAADVPDALRQQLEELKSFKAQVEDQFRIQKEAEEDAILQKQFDEIAEQYPDYDLKHTDPKTGMSLEMQVLEHARVNGIHSVKAAFRDMMYDDLVAKAVTKAKEATAKDLASRTQKGFLAESDKSLLSKYMSPAKRTNGGYMDDIMSGATELGIL